MPNGVPCSWMAAFYPGTEIFVARGDGATFTDVDGNRYLDMTQCDLSMVCGFGPAPIARAVAERFANGSHFLLPTEDAIAVCRLLRARFGMAAWQFTLSASAANTEAFRIARRATAKDKVLIFSGKYHGHIDETLVRGDDRGASEPDHHGLPRGVEQRTIEVPFNDLDAVERALKGGDVACVLAEPVMTNIGVIHPDDGFHAGLRDLTRRHGALLIIDETHTQVACFGGFTRKWRLEPDILTLGKCVGGGVPIGVYGLTAELSDLVERNTEPQVAVDGKTLAIGGTTYGNALNMAAARAALEAVLTEDGYRRVEALGRGAGRRHRCSAGAARAAGARLSPRQPLRPLPQRHPAAQRRGGGQLHQQRPQPLGPPLHGQSRRVGADLHPRPVGIVRAHRGRHRDLSQRVRRHADPAEKRRPARVSHHAKDWPPSTTIVCPVTQLARSLARKSATLAMSSGDPNRPQGMPLRRR